MVRVKCNFYLKNGLIVSGEANYDTIEDFVEAKEKKVNHFEEVWFNGRKGYSTWGNACVRSDECVGYDYEVLEETSEEYNVEPTSIDDILKGAFFNG